MAVSDLDWITRWFGANLKKAPLGKLGFLGRYQHLFPARKFASSIFQGGEAICGRFVVNSRKFMENAWVPLPKLKNVYGKRVRTVYQN